MFTKIFLKLGTVELICISKNDFKVITSDNLQKLWNINAETIKILPYFKQLNSMELNKCSSVSFIKTFAQNEYVFGKI